jgi:hypothetical protein
MKQQAQPVNYIRHLSAALEKLAADDRCKPQHISLYMMLFHQWNGQHFPGRLKVFRSELMEDSKIGNKNTYTTCLKNLHEWGYLGYFPSSSKYHASEVALTVFIGTETGKGTDTGSGTHESDTLTTVGNGADKGSDTGSDTGTGNGGGTTYINDTKPIQTNTNVSNRLYTPTQKVEESLPQKDYLESSSTTSLDAQEPAAGRKKKVAPKKKEASADLLFSESPYADKALFRKAFAGTDYESANLDYYHEVISNWSQSKAARKKDWIATAKNWMLNDYREGKLLTTQPSATYGKSTQARGRTERGGVDLDALFALIDYAHSPKQPAS